MSVDRRVCCLGLRSAPGVGEWGFYLGEDPCGAVDERTDWSVFQIRTAPSLNHNSILSLTSINLQTCHRSQNPLCQQVLKLATHSLTSWTKIASCSDQ